jgi:ribosomal protein S18 acetylase RimI-like enzyme
MNRSDRRLDMNGIVCKRYEPINRQIVFDISNISNLEPYDISELDDLYSSWPDGQYVAYDIENEKTVGFISGKIHDEQTNRIYMFAVLPEYRSQGVGQMLLNQFYSISEGMGSDIILEVRASNIRAKKLYDSNGFVEICRINGLYANGEEAVRMKRGNAV